MATQHQNLGSNKPTRSNSHMLYLRPQQQASLARATTTTGTKTNASRATSAHTRALPFPSGPRRTETPHTGGVYKMPEPTPLVLLCPRMRPSTEGPSCHLNVPHGHPDLQLFPYWNRNGRIKLYPTRPPAKTPPRPNDRPLPLIYLRAHRRHKQQPIRGRGATPPPLTRPMGRRGARQAANQEAQVPPLPPR